MLIAIAAAVASVAMPSLSGSDTPVTPAACAQAAERREIVRRGTGTPIFLTALAEAPSIAERRMEERVARLAARGGMSPKAQAEMMLTLMAAPNVVAAREAASAKVDQLFERLDGALRSRDEVAICHALVDTAAELPRLGALADRHVLMTEQAIEAEARRRGLPSGAQSRQASLRP